MEERFKGISKEEMDVIAELQQKKGREILFQVSLTPNDGEMDYIIKPNLQTVKLRALVSYLESMVEYFKEEVISFRNQYDVDLEEESEE